jgi:hypothetical protein
MDKVFSGFQRGDFAVLFGDSLCRSLLFRLCVRCQLPFRKGGLNSSVVYVDGGNAFDLYSVSSIAQKYSLEPSSVLGRIFISRAFTAYQMYTLVFEKLEEALKKYSPRLVVVSDIVDLFLDRDVPRQEGDDSFKEMTQRLVDLTSKWRIITVATYSPRSQSPRRRFLQSILFASATTVMEMRKINGVSKFNLLHHPTLKPFEIVFPSEGVKLDLFMET